MELDMRTTAMTRELAADILSWRYGDEYRMYNESSTEEDIAEMTDGSCLAVTDGDGRAAGFYCYGPGARANDLDGAGVYADESRTDFGLGMRPDLCGKGIGEEFMKAGLREGTKLFCIKKYRLSVDSTNLRAVKLYTRVGFRETARFRGMYNSVESIFIIMVFDAEMP